VKWVPGFSWG